MIGEIRVQALGKRIEQRAHLLRHARILGTRQTRDLERAVAPVAAEPALALHLGAPAKRADVVVLDAPEVVLGLRVGEAEHRAGVRLAEHVRNPVRVAIDRDAIREAIARARARRRAE